jgi:HAD superfamily hydrolase (TIGR01458 family)
MTKNNLVSFLKGMGLNVAPESVFSAPQVALEYCKLKGYKKISLIVPDPEMEQDFSSFQLVDINPDAIVLGDMGQLFTFELLNRLFNEAINGSQIVAMHKNRYWKSAMGLTIDLGVFVAALEYASGKSVAVMGKPHPNMFWLAIQLWNVPPDSVFVIGDDIEGDILGAKTAGMKSVLVKTGKFREDVLAQSKTKPDYIIESVANLPSLLKLS